MKMTKKMRCECGKTLQLKQKQCICVCTNCEGQHLFLCHKIPFPSDLLQIVCPICSQKFSAITCGMCSSLMVIQNFKLGKIYGCPCGFQATFVLCNKCNATLALPSKWDYQNTPITCKKCTHTFKYFVCDLCDQTNYYRFDSAQKKCFNPHCQLLSSEVKMHPKWVKEQEQSRGTFINILQDTQKSKKYYSPVSNKILKAQSNPYEIKSKTDVIQQNVMQETNKETNICKVCLENEAIMINDQCFHLALCLKCSQSVKNQCPICRAIGNYKAVFKS